MSIFSSMRETATSLSALIGGLEADKLKLWLDTIKWLFSTFILGVVALWINSSIQEREVKIKELEQERVFLETFVSDVMSNKIDGRIRLAHYVKSTASDPNVILRWTKYHEDLRKECEANTKRFNRQSAGKVPESVKDEVSLLCDVGGVGNLTKSNETFSYKPNAISISSDARIFSYKTFDDIFEVVEKWEGGYVDHPQDPGGAYNYGISVKLLEKWRGKPQTKENLRNLTQSEAKELFRELYYNIYDEIKSDAIRAALFEASVNHGPSRAIRFLQRVLGMQEDGNLGPITRQLANTHDENALISNFICARVIFYRKLAAWEIFGKGWMNRMKDIVGSDDFNPEECYL